MAGRDHRGGEVRLLGSPHGVDHPWGLEAAAAVDRAANSSWVLSGPRSRRRTAGGGPRSGGDQRQPGGPGCARGWPAPGRRTCGRRHRFADVQVVGVEAQTYPRPVASKVTVGSRPLAESFRPPRLRQLAPASKEAYAPDVRTALLVVGDAGTQQIAGVAGVGRQAWLSAWATNWSWLTRTLAGRTSSGFSGSGMWERRLLPASWVVPASAGADHQPGASHRR